MEEDEDVGTYPVSPARMQQLQANSVAAGAGGVPGGGPLSQGAAAPPQAPLAANPYGLTGGYAQMFAELQRQSAARTAQQQAYMDSLQKREGALANQGMSDLDRASLLFQAAGALGAPTTGTGLAPALGNLGTAMAGPLSKAAEAERQRKTQLQQLQDARMKMAAEMSTGPDISSVMQLYRAQQESAPKLGETERLLQSSELTPEQKKEALFKKLGIGEKEEAKEEVKNIKLSDGSEISVVRRGGKSYNPITNELLDEAKINALTTSTKVADRQDQALELGIPVETADPYAALPPKDRERARVARYNADTRVLQREASEIPDSVLRDEIRENKTFVALNNENRKTGPAWAKVGNWSADAQQMGGIESKLTIGAGKDLKGAASDRDVAMFGRASPSTSKDFEANANIATYNILRNQTELERRAFMRDYLEVNRTLGGAERKWKQYLEANPFFKYPEKFDPTKLDIKKLQKNDQRMSYQDYFRSQSARGATPVVRNAQGQLVTEGQ